MEMRCSHWIVKFALAWFLSNGIVKGLQEDQGNGKTEVRKGDLGLGVFPRSDCRFLHQTDVLGLFARLLCPEHPQGDCEDVLNSPVEIHQPNGVYALRPDINAYLFALCDMDENGWTIIQQRIKGNSNFNRSWEDYKKGFGTINENEDFWLGNENIWRLTNAVNSQEAYTLHIELTTASAPTEKRIAEYSYFRIENEANKYKLVIGNYSGDAGDAMHTYNGAEFSTNYYLGWYDRCSALYRTGGWWFNEHCHANLNGVPGIEHTGIFWDTLPMDTIAKVRMMIRRKK